MSHTLALPSWPGVARQSTYLCVARKEDADCGAFPGYNDETATSP